MKKLLTRVRAWSIRRKVTATILVLILAGGGYFYFGGRGSAYQFVTVNRGPLTERVDLTGAVVPVSTVLLSFQHTGTVAGVYKHVDDAVTVGSVIATLNTNSLRTQLAQAEANVDAAQAKLASLKAGAQPSSIAVSQAALNTAKQKLANDYASAVSSIIDAYAKATDAVRTKLNIFFTNPETSSARILFVTGDTQAGDRAQYGRAQLNNMFSSWQHELAGLNVSSSPATVNSSLSRVSQNLTQIAQFLADLSEATIRATSFPSSSGLTVETAKTTVNASISKINTALASVNAAAQTIRAQEALVAQEKAQLALTLTGATKETIDAQKAAVGAAQAQADTIRVTLAQMVLRSPITGVVSVQNAKVGQTETPGTPIATVISNNSLEVDVKVPEVDLGRVALGNPVDITFDTFPGETFSGKIFSINPAGTVTDGVVGYTTKISFDTLDPRIKSGLTANLSIVTKKRASVLFLPQYAILQTDAGSFVEKLENGVVTKTQITTGIRDDSGDIEILSGVVEGEQVLNIGLKSGK